MRNPQSNAGRHIVQSGMSDIYKVHTRDGTRAVKVARADVPFGQDSLLAEATVLFTLGPHPNIVKPYKLGKIDGRIYLELEYLERGLFYENFEYLIIEEEAINIVRGISNALAHMHARGYRHGDIKPDNIWLGEAPKLFDFGSVAKIEGQESNYSCFTPAYLLMRGEIFSLWADVFALGLSIHEMLTGEVPFEFMQEFNWRNKSPANYQAMMKKWDKNYAALKDQIWYGDYSMKLKALLSTMTNYRNSLAAHDAGLIVKFMDRHFPEK